MQKDGWISVRERTPTIADSDVQQCVIVWHRYNGAMTMGWHQVEGNPFVTHWRPCPAAPADLPEHYRTLWERRREA